MNRDMGANTGEKRFNTYMSVCGFFSEAGRLAALSALSGGLGALLLENGLSSCNKLDVAEASMLGALGGAILGGILGIYKSIDAACSGTQKIRSLLNYEPHTSVFSGATANQILKWSSYDLKMSIGEVSSVFLLGGLLIGWCIACGQAGYYARRNIQSEAINRDAVAPAPV